MLETIFVIFFLFVFILMSIFILLMMYSALRGYRYFLSPIKLESIKDLCCPKCTSKELELIGYRTVRCRKCAFTFSIELSKHSFPYSIWWFGLWPLFWMWWVHKE